MDLDMFWYAVTHQAAKPLDEATKNAAKQLADEMHVQGGPMAAAMQAACAYYGWLRAAPDYDEALCYALKSAREGEPWGYFYLGVCLHQGQGIAVDYVAALRALAAAAAGGVTLAAYDLGMCCLHGHGMPENPLWATMFFRNTAADGLALADYLLGWCYASGKGVRQDLGLAEFHYARAATNGLQRAEEPLANLRAYLASVR